MFISGAFMATGSDMALPADLITFVRREIPPHQMWFGGETLRLLQVSNQYALVVTDRDRYLAGFVKNCQFMERWRPEQMPYVSDQLDCRDHIAVDTAWWLANPTGIEITNRIWADYKSIYIITGPREYAVVREAARKRAGLTVLFDANQYLILRLDFDAAAEQ
jgi:hypothetical protein